MENLSKPKSISLLLFLCFLWWLFEVLFQPIFLLLLFLKCDREEC